MQSSLNFLQKINDAVTDKHKINLYVLRIDLIHPTISGNKNFKLKYNLQEAKKQDKKTIITFGGAFSNHIAATAFAGKENGFETIGIIRGDEFEKLNSTLKIAQENGMQLHYVSRELYRDKDALYKYVSEKFSAENYYLIPEGGSNKLGVEGCKEILELIQIPFDYVCCACGTGATLAGIILSMSNEQKAIGFQVLKAENYIEKEIKNWLKEFNHEQKNNWQINENYHFGGYAKRTSELINFVQQFEKENSIPLDFIYTGKMMFGIYDLIEKDFFNTNESIVAIHTGGLQGNDGFDF